MENNQDNKKDQTYSSNEVATLLESLNDGIQLISEQHGGVIKRLDNIDGRLEGIDGRLDKIDGRLDRIEEDVVEIKHELKKKVDYDEFEKLEKRVIKLEKLAMAR
jgi:DNA repair ATPase RecN